MQGAPLDLCAAGRSALAIPEHAKTCNGALSPHRQLSASEAWGLEGRRINTPARSHFGEGMVHPVSQCCLGAVPQGPTRGPGLRSEIHTPRGGCLTSCSSFHVPGVMSGYPKCIYVHPCFWGQPGTACASSIPSQAAGQFQFNQWFCSTTAAKR